MSDLSTFPLSASRHPWSKRMGTQHGTPVAVGPHGSKQTVQPASGETRLASYSDGAA